MATRVHTVARQQRLADEFAERGLVRIPAAFTPAQASAMGDAIWRHVERNTPCRRGDPSTWDARPISFKRLKKHSAFDALTASPAVRAALDMAFGPGEWLAARAGPQVLMTLPNATTWRLPDRLWHTDAGFEPRTFPTFGVKLFACVHPVRPHGGGTLALAGSHRLVERYRPNVPRDGRAAISSLWNGFMRQDPWLRSLADPRRQDDAGLLDGPYEVDGLPLEIVELTGDPGDVWMMHLHTFHCVSPNARDTPRMMVAQAVSRAAAEPG